MSIESEDLVRSTEGYLYHGMFYPKEYTCGGWLYDPIKYSPSHVLLDEKKKDKTGFDS